MRKFKISLTFILFLLVSLSVAYADHRETFIQKEMDSFDQRKETIILSKPDRNIERVHTFSIGYQNFYSGFSKYKRSSLKGNWQGLDGKYIFRPPQGNILNNPIINFYSLEGLYAWGKSNKRGVVTPDFVTIKSIPGAMYEARALIGRDFNASGNLRFTPYVGYGLRYRTDKNGGHQQILSDTTPVWGFDQSVLYHYIPLGLTTEYEVKNDYEIAFNLEYDFFIKGRTKYHLTDFDPYATQYYGFRVDYEDIRFTQRGGFGLRSSLKFLKHFPLADVYFEPFVRYWNIKASKTGSGNIAGDIAQQTAREDKNYTLEGGLKTGLQF